MFSEQLVAAFPARGYWELDKGFFLSTPHTFSCDMLNEGNFLSMEKRNTLLGMALGGWRAYKKKINSKTEEPHNNCL